MLQGSWNFYKHSESLSETNLYEVRFNYHSCKRSVMLCELYYPGLANHSKSQAIIKWAEMFLVVAMFLGYNVVLAWAGLWCCGFYFQEH